MSTTFNSIGTRAGINVATTLDVTGVTTLTGDLTVTTGATQLQDTVVSGTLTMIGVVGSDIDMNG